MFLSAGHLAKWIHFRPALALAVLWAKFSKRFLQPAFGNVFRPLAELDQAAFALKYTKFNVPNMQHTGNMQQTKKQPDPCIDPSTIHDSESHNICCF